MKGMNCFAAQAACLSSSGGLQVVLSSSASKKKILHDLSELLAQHQLVSACTVSEVPQGSSTVLRVQLTPEIQSAWVPAFDTLNLHRRLPSSDLDTTSALVREIMVALLASPVALEFPNVEALVSHIRVRQRIAQAAQKTALAFKTEAAERPLSFWRDGGDDAGFVLQSGCRLVDALIAATQPDATGKLYDFSCYRATEYVILLGIAQELQSHNPELLTQLEHLNQVHAVRSGQFHEVYLIEYGSMQAPLPSRFYVPGDRLWFRNPDERSSDVMGYEGSWVIYMGGGLFSNFWQRDRPYTLESKAIEIYHWRDGAYRDAQGLWHMDETVVDQHVAHTMANPQTTAQVLQRMLRLRDPQGVYAEGGCIDSTREYPRGVSLDHCELVLPAVQAQV